MICTVTLYGCAAPIYKSPDVSRSEVKVFKETIKTIIPHYTSLTHTEAENKARPIFDKIMSDAVNVCRMIGEATKCSPVKFEVEDTTRINAYASNRNDKLVVGMTRGIIQLLADQPEEIAMIIGHEFAHLAANHLEENLKHAKLGGALMGGLAVIAAASNSSYYSSEAERQAIQRRNQEMIQDSIRSGYIAGWYSFSKGQEYEADYIGAYLAWRSGYDFTGSAFIEMGALHKRDPISTNQKKKRNMAFQYWNTHPGDAQRAARIQATLKEINQLFTDGQLLPLPPELIERYAKKVKLDRTHVLEMNILKNRER